MKTKRESLSADGLVENAYSAVRELADVRQAFKTGEIGRDQAAINVGLFNATARVIQAAINSEKWKHQNTTTPPSPKVNNKKKSDCSTAK